MSIIPVKKLNDGNEIPVLGLGVFQQADELTYNSIRWALDAGYRLIDTASSYYNEKAVGQAIRDSGIPREEIKIATKLWVPDMREGKVREAFDASRKELGVDYIDFYLVHFVENNSLLSTWEKMLALKQEGLATSVGFCNTMIHHLEDIIASGMELPCVDQCNCYPAYQNNDLMKFCQSKGIVFECWGPLGGRKLSMMNNPTIVSLAQKHNVHPAQILIRWHLQRDCVLFPGCDAEGIAKSNLKVFEFALDDDDMAAINALEAGVRQGPDPDNIPF